MKKDGSPKKAEISGSNICKEITLSWKPNWINTPTISIEKELDEFDITQILLALPKRIDNPVWIVNQSQYDFLKQHPSFVDGNPSTIGGTPLYVVE